MKRSLKKQLTPNFWFQKMNRVWDKHMSKQCSFEPLQLSEIIFDTDYILVQPSCNDILKMQITNKLNYDGENVFAISYIREYAHKQYIGGFTCLDEDEISKYVYKVIEK